MSDCGKNSSLCSIFRSSSKKEEIANKTFQPPKNRKLFVNVISFMCLALYSISPNSRNEQCAQVSFIHSNYDGLLLSQYSWIKESCYIWKKQNNNAIVILYLQNKK